MFSSIVLTMGVALGEMAAVDDANFLNKLDAGGITDEELVKLLAEEMQGDERKVFHKGKGEEGLVYSEKMPNHEVRLRALDMALKLKNLYPTERKQIEVEGGLPVIQLSEEEC